MIHYYVYIQDWGSTLNAKDYNAYTDNEFMMIQYLKQIEFILTKNHYVGKSLLNSVKEDDFESESDLLQFLNGTEEGAIFSKENKIYSINSEFNDYTIYLNRMIHARFYDGLFTGNELTKLKADLYRMSSPRMVETIFNYVNKPYSTLILNILKSIHERYIALSEALHDDGDYMIMSTNEIWETIDIVPELLRYMNIEIMEIFRLSIPFNIK